MRKSPENPPPKRKSSWTKIAREFTNPPPKPKIMPTDKDDEKIHQIRKKKKKKKILTDKDSAVKQFTNSTPK